MRSFPRKIKLAALAFYLCSFSALAAPSFAQLTLPQINLTDVTIEQMILEIEKSSDYVFLVADDARQSLQKKVSIDTGGQTVAEVMGKALEHTDLVFVVSGSQVAVFKGRTAASAQQPESRIRITGRVVDTDGEPLAGVAVVLKSNPLVGTSTGGDGEFVLNIPDMNQTLVFSIIGMEQQELTIAPSVTNYNVTMSYSQSDIETIVVQTGMFQRDRVSYTGSISQFSGDDLKSIGNTNVFQSLKTLDPSFIMLDDREMGSNPNATPTFELRGQGSASLNAVTDQFSSDPNQPLFILNGVEVGISRIMDLDINRVASITLLKDASSAAIYGSKAANGVVVIETIKPKGGAFNVYYTGDFAVEAPDLTVYNMMDASEKLEFERLAGVYNVAYDTGLTGSVAAVRQVHYDNLYNHRLSEVQRGVDTYWLAEPLRVGFTHGHSARVSGGDDALTVDVGAKFRNRAGAMKGSKRQTWAANADLNYRSGGFIINNSVDVGGYTATESPYGNFSNWVNANPYYRMRNEDGTIPKYMQQPDLENIAGWSYTPPSVVNPLYNAMLNSRDETTNFYVTENFSLQYRLNEYFQFRAGAYATLTRQDNEVFKDPSHTDYADVAVSDKGRYTKSDTKIVNYNVNLNATYGQTFGMHSVTANARLETAQNNSKYFSTVAQGFPFGSIGTPNQANSYRTEAKPGYSRSLRRSVALVAAVNYNYQQRYLFDFTYRLDGATTFGSNELYKSFWSAGLGWNLDREAFAEDWQWLDRLKLRGSMGVTGNQNVGVINSQSVYQYYLGGNVFGQGASLYALGTPDIPWQESQDIGAGIDFRALGGRLSLVFDVYRKTTDPLIINVPQVPSTGIGTKPMDLGKIINNGLDFVVSFSPIYKLQERIQWTIRLTGAHVKSEYSGFGDKLDQLNNTLRNTKYEESTMRMYMDGYQSTYIWAVQSGGIDPSTGEEVFIKKDGSRSYVYSSDDWVVVGNTRPILQGVIGSTFRYKNFTAGLHFRYNIGADIYNQTLYTKVENIIEDQLGLNQDKRALYDRWFAPGDQAKFKGVRIDKVYSPQTSRFVQKNDYFLGESISISYEINRNPWLMSKLGIDRAQVTLYGNDIFRAETSKTERGTSYPYARTFSMSLNLSF